MDALPRLTDMLLFVFIVRHFFYASIDYRSFACSLKVWRTEAIKGEQPCSARFQLRASKASLVDGTAINWSVDSVSVKTNHNILVM